MGTAPALNRFEIETYTHPENGRPVMVLVCKFCEAKMAIPSGGDYSKPLPLIVTKAHIANCPSASI